ncbi:MAG: hypothetical protein ACOCX1_03115 [Fimbriimonadaceae bacterium]
MKYGAVLAALVMAFGLIGCGKETQTEAREGVTAYLGNGTFNSRHGQMDVVAQLELYDEGTYMLLFLEPAPLAMMGSEQGVWQEQQGAVYLQPKKMEAGADASLFDQMSAANSENREPKTLEGTVGGTLVQRDPKMTLTYEIN